MFKSSMFRSLLLMLFAGVGLAQVPNPPQRFKGNLVSVDGDSVTLTDKDGKHSVITMKSGWTVSVNEPSGLDAFKIGDFIASTNVPLDSGSGKSKEVRILEPGYRPEQGTHAVSAENSNMMTHGTVKAVTKTEDGIDLEVVYPGGVRHLIVANGTSVTVSILKEHSVLKPGMMVEGVTRTDPDGVARASRLQLAK